MTKSTTLRAVPVTNGLNLELGEILWNTTSSNLPLRPFADYWLRF